MLIQSEQALAEEIKESMRKEILSQLYAMFASVLGINRATFPDKPCSHRTAVKLSSLALAELPVPKHPLPLKTKPSILAGGLLHPEIEGLVYQSSWYLWLSLRSITRHHGLCSPTQAQPRIPLHPDSKRCPGTQPGTGKAAFALGPVGDTESLSKPGRRDVYPARTLSRLAVSHPTPQGNNNSPAQLCSPPWQPRAAHAWMTRIYVDVNDRERKKKKKGTLNF